MNENTKYSALRKNILLAMILVPIVTFLIIAGICYFKFSHTISSKTVSNLSRIVKDHRHMIEAFLMDRKADLELIADTYTFEEVVDNKTLSNIFDRLQRKSAAFFDLGVFNTSGVHVSYQGPYKLTGKNYSNEEWFQTVLEKGYYVSDVFLGFRQSPHFIIAITRRLNGDSWVLRATIDTYMFNDLVEDIRIGKTGEAYIVNSDGVFQTDRRSGGDLLQIDTDFTNFPVVKNDIHSFFLTDKNHVEYLYATTWMKDKKWLLVVRQEKADALVAIRSATYTVVLICLIGSIVIVGIAFYVTDRIIRRMEILDSEKSQLNQQLIGATRLAEIGEMATGFAHEINNPLQIIKSEHAMINMALSEISEKVALEPEESVSELYDSMDQISLQISRCASITQAILKFGRQGQPNPQNIDLNEFLPQVISMVSKKAAVNGIHINEDMSTAPTVVYGDPSELQQVLVNLMNNAMDAVEENRAQPEKEIRIKTRIKDNETVRIDVTDTGIGISPENMRKIFTPFFTTKPVGKGTGLGLAVCYGIIDKMGGKMDVTSELGEGTTFSIVLPLIRETEG